MDRLSKIRFPTLTTALDYLRDPRRESLDQIIDVEIERLRDETEVCHVDKLQDFQGRIASLKWLRDTLPERISRSIKARENKQK